ncbi:MAG: prepilin-type N-terminal cleavage/methylation domain-containing protein [Polyangiales bacterium]
MSHHPRSAGFTLIELMIGVAIVGILAALAIPTFKSYVYKGRVTEAVTVLNEIKSRQEAYRSRFGNYAAVSGNGEWSAATYTPTTVPGAQAVAWPSSAAWEELGLSAPGAVRFRYATVAGQPGMAPPTGSNLDQDEFWFAAQAEGDLNADGETFILEVYSDSRIMYNSAVGKGGWE